MLRAHSDSVWTICYCEGRLISGSDDSTAYVWGSDGEQMLKLQGHTAGVLGVACGADLYVTGSGDCTVKVWSDTGDCTQTLRGHKGAVTAVSLSDHHIFSASVDMSVIQWSLGSGAAVQQFGGHTREVTSLCTLGPSLFSSSDAGVVLMHWTEGRASTASAASCMASAADRAQEADGVLLDQLQEALVVADKQRSAAILELRAIGSRLSELEKHITASDERR